MDLGNFLIKHVVEELQHEFPSITDFSTLSPVPGFVQWLKLKINDAESEKGEREAAEERCLVAWLPGFKSRSPRTTKLVCSWCFLFQILLLQVK